MKIATTKKRILQFIEYKGLSKLSFYETTGMKRGFLDGDKLETSIPDTFIAIIIATFPELNIDWLITGQGEMLKTNELRPNSQQLKSERHLIPLYDTIAIAGRQELDMSPISEPAEYIDAGDWFRDATAAMRIHGDSMYPIYKSGCIAALKEVVNKDLIMYGEDYVIETNEYRTIKRIQKGKSDLYILACSANTERWEDGSDRGRLIYEPFDISRDEIRRLLLVLGSVRRNHSSRIVFNRYI